MSFKNKCRLLNLQRSSAYYKLSNAKEKQKEEKDLKIRDEIENIQLEFPYYGYRTATAELKRRNFEINKKKVQRIMKKYGLMSQIRRLFKSFTNSKHNFPKYPNLIKNLIITTPNQVWGADITYIRLKKEFIYLAAVIDFFARTIKGWQISKALDHSLTIEALENSLKKNPAPDIHHSDQGVQYCAEEYTDKLKQNNIQISMSDKGNPYQNNITESFFKTLKYNEVYLNEYETFEEAKDNIEHFIEIVYHKKRLHSSLGYLPPEEFEKKYLQEQQKQFISGIQTKNELHICSR